MNTSDYIAIVSIAVTTIIAIVGGIYAVASNTKKFELAEAYKKEILDWYSDTINVMISILSKVKNEKKDYKFAYSIINSNNFVCSICGGSRRAWNKKRTSSKPYGSIKYRTRISFFI